MPETNRVREPIRGVVYPSAQLLERYLRDGPLTRETVAGALVRSFERHADRVILDGPEGTLTYAQFDELSDCAAVGLLELGLQPLDRVVFQVPNGRDLLIAAVACLKAGLIPVCTLAAHREVEIGHLARHSGARAHVVAGSDAKFEFVAFAERMRAEAPSLQVLLATGNAPVRRGVVALRELVARTDPAAAHRRIRALIESFDPLQVVLFQLSGGTTGVPKIIPRFNTEYLYQIRSTGEFLGIRSDDVLPCQAPMLHNAPTLVCWGPAFLSGATILTDADWSAAGLGRMLMRRPPTQVLLPPPTVSEFLGALEQVPSGHRRIRLAVSLRNCTEIARAINAPAVPLFGMSEGIIMLGRPDDPPEALATTVGRPICEYDEIRLLEPGTEHPVAAGERGELVFRGPNSLPGYFDAPERNREVFTSDGFYRSGDLMRLREIDGRTFYAFEGRIKDVIDRGGEKINCEEVERFLLSYPGVRDAALVSVPDPKYGERGCACLVMAEARAAPGVRELGAHLAGQGLAKFKWPERVEAFEALPFNRTGKTDKAALQRALAERPVKTAAARAPSTVQENYP